MVRLFPNVTAGGVARLSGDDPATHGGAAGFTQGSQGWRWLATGGPPPASFRGSLGYADRFAAARGSASGPAGAPSVEEVGGRLVD